jgi:hypothetical protein
MEPFFFLDFDQPALGLGVFVSFLEVSAARALPKLNQYHFIDYLAGVSFVGFLYC